MIQASSSLTPISPADRPYKKLKRPLRAGADESARVSLYTTKSLPCDPPSTGKSALKFINHPGEEVLKVYGISPGP